VDEDEKKSGEEGRGSALPEEYRCRNFHYRPLDGRHCYSHVSTIQMYIAPEVLLSSTGIKITMNMIVSQETIKSSIMHRNDINKY
jgi:hypothetical protein